MDVEGRVCVCLRVGSGFCPRVRLVLLSGYFSNTLKIRCI